MIMGWVGGDVGNPTQIVDIGCGIGACIFSARAGTVCANTALLLIFSAACSRVSYDEIHCVHNTRSYYLANVSTSEPLDCRQCRCMQT